MRKLLFYSAFLLYSISTQNFASDNNQMELLQSEVRAIKKTNTELAIVNQLFKHCKMEMECIQTGLQLLASQKNQVAATMLEDLQKKKNSNPKALEACYLKEKEAVSKQLKKCNLNEDLSKPLPYNPCVVERLGKLGMKGNLLAQMLLLQVLHRNRQGEVYKEWKGRFEQSEKPAGSCS